MNMFSGTLACLLFVLAATAVAGDGDTKKNASCCKSKAEQTAKCDPKAKTAPDKQQAKAKPAVVPGGAGMVVTLDGNRGPDGDAEISPEMRAALEEMVNTSSEGLRQQTLADGTVIVDLEGRFQSAMVVSVGKDGKLKGSCYSTVPGHKCASKHVKPQTETKKKKEK